MILGITGAIGSGKHTAAEFLATRGWVILDADRIAHNIYRPYTHAWKAVTKVFGEGILGQHDVIDRQKLGRIIFEDPSKRKNLNAIMHPAIIHYLTEQLHRNYRSGSRVAIVAALWKELKLKEFCDKILLIKTDPAVAQKRLELRGGISSGEFLKRLKTQKDPENPDFIIENNGSLSEFYRVMANDLTNL